VQSSVTQPIPRCLCDFAARDDERVIHENTLADLGIENVMPKHHGHLIVDFGDDGTNELQVWFIHPHPKKKRRSLSRPACANSQVRA
jgi:hypothetical protein